MADGRRRHEPPRYASQDRSDHRSRSRPRVTRAGSLAPAVWYSVATRPDRVRAAKATAPHPNAPRCAEAQTTALGRWLSLSSREQCATTPPPQRRRRTAAAQQREVPRSATLGHPVAPPPRMRLGRLCAVAAAARAMSSPRKPKRAPAPAATPEKKRKTSPHFAADAKGAFPPVVDATVPPHTLLLGTQPSDNSLRAGQYRRRVEFEETKPVSADFCGVRPSSNGCLQVFHDERERVLAHRGRRARV